MPVNKEGDVIGNQEEITKFTNWLLNKVGEYLVENNVSYIDTFLSLHNTHKRIVDDIAKRWAIDGFSADRTYRLADMTWRKAMRELKRC